MGNGSNKWPNKVFISLVLTQLLVKDSLRQKDLQTFRPVTPSGPQFSHPKFKKVAGSPPRRRNHRSNSWLSMSSISFLFPLLEPFVKHVPDYYRCKQQEVHAVNCSRVFIIPVTLSVFNCRESCLALHHRITMICHKSMSSNVNPAKSRKALIFYAIS